MLRTAIIANRVSESDPDTEEIRKLTEAAGARVVGEVTQTRERDPGTELGRGKVAELGSMVEERGADTVVVDADLTPRQTVTLEDEIGVSVVDRQRVVLEIFADQARTRRAQLQVELARLKYRLPRVRERADEGLLNRLTESGTPYYDLVDRIDELERKLDDLPAVDEQFRDQRRDAGFDLVALAGYTNAGKTTLLRRLADDLELQDTEESHGDLAETAGVNDRLFETLETTTRRATIDGRELLLTDTVGFLDDLPHWLVESFRGTLAEVAEADAVVLVADLAQPTDELRRKLETVHETLGDDHPPVVTALNKVDQLSPAECERGDDHPPVVTALNKVDQLSPAECERRTEAVADLAPRLVHISALEGSLAGLESTLVDTLPSLERTRLNLPLTDEAMSLVSQIHDEAAEAEVSYDADAAVVEFAARQATVEQLQARGREVANEG